VVDALAAGPAVLERRARVLDGLVDTVHQGGLAARRGLAGGRERGVAGGAGQRAAGGAGERVAGGAGERRRTRIVAEGAVGAVLGVVHARLAVRDERPLASLVNQLMGMIVLPYLGVEAAERELARAAPRYRRAAQSNGDPLRGLEMRLTYRTVRVLLAIAELGGRGSGGGESSNRQVADASGVHDQGQISKLLARLEHLGLIVNEAQDSGRGVPNAWALTPRGREVERTLRAQAGS
jgi:DNA-binding MarR family transcriptional regulator